jgi:hypothetical protein
MAIDVGSEAIDRDAYNTGGYTGIGEDNPANADGNIDTIECWFDTNAVGFIAATFIRNSAGNYTSRDSVTIGDITSSSKQTVTGLSLDVVTNDRLGFYCASGNMDRTDSGGAGIYYKSPAGNYIDGNPYNYINTGIPEALMSLYATGTETAAGHPTIKRFGGVPYAALNRGVW